MSKEDKDGFDEYLKDSKKDKKDSKKVDDIDLNVEDGSFGEVKIAAGVLATISAHAAMEIDGVVETFGGFTSDLKSMMGLKTDTKGIKVNFIDEKLEITALLNVKYGNSIPEISKEVQARIKEKIEYMTGLSVEKVNVRIAGVTYEEPIEEA